MTVAHEPCPAKISRRERTIRGHADTERSGGEPNMRSAGSIATPNLLPGVLRLLVVLEHSIGGAGVPVDPCSLFRREALARAGTDG
jgi:hypothetical protein